MTTPEIPAIDALITRYRPRTFDEVVGHNHVVKALKKVIASKSAHAFLLTGPAGTGKTTLARIIAREYGCAESSVLELDGATYTGIDAIRSVIESSRYAALGGNPMRAFLIDEAHRLSSQAWSALLKTLEEPSAHTVWVLCTTEGNKVPKTIKTRCVSHELSDVDGDTIFDLLVKVCEAEGFDTPDDILDLISRECLGSPRQALAYLATCSAASNVSEAARLMQSAGATPEVITLCRFLLSGKSKSWKQVTEMLAPMKDQNGESIRQVIIAYMTSVALGSKSANDAARALWILDCFIEPYQSNDKLAPVLLGVGRALRLGEG